jgi:hypothetical protein
MTARIACHARTAHLRRAHSRRNAELELITQRSRAPRMPAYGLKSSGNDEARHAGVWTCAFALMDSWSCVSTGRGWKSSHTGRKRGVAATRPVVTVTDQGDAIRAPVHANVFQHGVAIMGDLGAFERSAAECRSSGRRALTSRLTFGPNENAPPPSFALYGLVVATARHGGRRLWSLVAELTWLPPEIGGSRRSVIPVLPQNI